MSQPAATKLHACPDQLIRYSLHARVAAGAVLRYRPRELILHASAEYHQQVYLDLAPGAEAVLWEIVSPGRLYERFQYRRLVFRLEACLAGRLIALDAVRVEPGSAAALGGFTHFASLFQFGPQLIQANADDVHARLQAAGITGSASLLPAYGLAVRLLGNSADVLRSALALFPGRERTACRLRAPGLAGERKLAAAKNGHHLVVEGL